MKVCAIAILIALISGITCIKVLCPAFYDENFETLKPLYAKTPKILKKDNNIEIDNLKNVVLTSFFDLNDGKFEEIEPPTGNDQTLVQQYLFAVFNTKRKQSPEEVVEKPYDKLIHKNNVIIYKDGCRYLNPLSGELTTKVIKKCSCVSFANMQAFTSSVAIKKFLDDNDPKKENLNIYQEKLHMNGLKVIERESLINRKQEGIFGKEAVKNLFTTIGFTTNMSTSKANLVDYKLIYRANTAVDVDEIFAFGPELIANLPIEYVTDMNTNIENATVYNDFMEKVFKGISRVQIPALKTEAMKKIKCSLLNLIKPTTFSAFNSDQINAAWEKCIVYLKTEILNELSEENLEDLQDGMLSKLSLDQIKGLRGDGIKRLANRLSIQGYKTKDGIEPKELTDDFATIFKEKCNKLGGGRKLEVMLTEAVKTAKVFDKALAKTGSVLGNASSSNEPHDI